MKKNTIILIVWLLFILWILWYAFWWKSVVPNFVWWSWLWSILPSWYDQLMFMKVDDDLRWVATQSNTLMDADSFSSMIDTIDELVMYQIFVDETPYNLIFIKWNNWFTIDQIEALWSLAWDENYDYRELWAWYWVYWEKSALTWYDAKSWDRISQDAWWKALSNELRKIWWNAWFLSKPVIEDWNFLVSQFADKLEYTYFVSNVSQNNPSGKLVLQLWEDTLSWPISWIDPKLLQSLWGEQIFYIEAQDLLSLFSVQKSQLETVLPLVLGQWWAAQWIAFDNTDVSILLDALEKNIAIVWMPSQISPLQVSLHLVFEDANAYTTLRKLWPLLQWLLSWMLWNTDSELIKETTTANWLNYVIEIPEIEVWSWAIQWLDSWIVWGWSLPLLSIEKIWDYAMLSVFSNDFALAEDPAELDLEYWENSKVVFWWDAWLMQQTFLQGTLEQWGQLVWTDALFQTWSLHWYIDVLPEVQQVSVEFSVQ